MPSLTSWRRLHDPGRAGGSGAGEVEIVTTDLRVLLIGGAPGAGKTTLARSLASRLGFAATTGDDLLAAGRILTTENSHPALHRMSGDHVAYFTDTSPERLVAHARELADVMWPVFESVISRHTRSRAPVVMDWWLLSPDRVRALDTDGVASVWLHIDPDELDRRERALDWFRAGSSDPDRMHANFMARSLWANEVAEGAGHVGLPVIHQSGRRTVTDLGDEALRRIEGSYSFREPG